MIRKQRKQPEIKENIPTADTKLHLTLSIPIHETFYGRHSPTLTLNLQYNTPLKILNPKVDVVENSYLGAKV